MKSVCAFVVVDVSGCVNVTIKKEKVLRQKEKEQGQVVEYVCPKKGGMWGEERGGASGMQIEVLSTYEVTGNPIFLDFSQKT